MTSSTVRRGTNADSRRANPLGAYIATVGSLILLVSVWLNWVGLGEGDSETVTASGYEADSLVPFMGLLGVGFSLALLYATKRADRRQHRGLSLASMAVGFASLVWILFFLIDPIETVKYAGANGEESPNVTTEFGVWIGLLGALIWTVGSFLLAKEPEGDIERETQRVETRTEARSEPARTARHAEVTETRHANVTDREVVDRHRTTGVRHDSDDVTAVRRDGNANRS